MAIRQQWAPSIGQRRTALFSHSPSSFFFPSFFRLPRQIFLAFPSARMHCSLPLCVSPEGIVLASIPASSFPPSLASPRTTDPFPCKLYVKWRTFIPAARTHRNTPYKTREHPSPLPHVHTALMGVKREFWLAGCSSVALPPSPDRPFRGGGGKRRWRALKFWQSLMRSEEQKVERERGGEKQEQI